MEPEIQELIDAASSEGDTGSDVALARMLQMQYDQEYNELLKAQEKHLNGSNKCKYMLLIPANSVAQLVEHQTATFSCYKFVGLNPSFGLLHSFLARKKC